MAAVRQGSVIKRGRLNGPGTQPVGPDFLGISYSTNEGAAAAAVDLPTGTVAGDTVWMVVVQRICSPSSSVLLVLLQEAPPTNGGNCARNRNVKVAKSGCVLCSQKSEAARGRDIHPHEVVGGLRGSARGGAH